VDLVDEAAVEAVFANANIDAVIHFAGLKAVGESVREPLKYYYNNLVGTLNLIRVMDRHDVRALVFNSSATVYGEHNPKRCLCHARRVAATRTIRSRWTSRDDGGMAG